jgi:hypothetical protein
VTDFIWRKLKTIKVPDPQGAAWTPALDFMISKRMYRLQVKSGNQWSLDGAAGACTSDGYDGGLPRNGDPVCPGSPLGSLIAKIGGSTADKVGIIFAVGRYCVYQATDDTKIGSLYLGANDLPPGMTKVAGQIEVDIEIAL